jgi:hypothetical protein
MSALPCVCGCPPGRHLMSKRDCRSCQTCSEYEPAEPVVLDVSALLGEVQDDVSRETELAARLADVERKLANRPSESDWVALRSERARLLQAVTNVEAERDRLRAEVESLRVQLEQAEQYARDLQDEGVVPDGTVVVLFAYDAWQCVGGSVNCSKRYFADDPDHGCGPLTPVTVTVSRRPAS